MTLYGKWQELAGEERTDAQAEEFWAQYFEDEKAVYEMILASPKHPIQGKFSEIVEKFGFDPVRFAGFMYGINTSLKAGEYDMEALCEDSDISLEVDLEKLYYNMLDAKADWLYGLPAWDNLLSDEARRGILKKYKAAGIFTAEATAGRNDPCPCGSGKKYKKCCGAN